MIDTRINITDERFELAQAQEMVNWEKHTSNVSRVLYELVEHSELVGPLRRHLPASVESCLEVGVGCYGLGFLAPHLFELVGTVDGLDPLPRLELNLADSDLQRYVEAIRRRVNYIQAPGERLPADDASYDLVACINVIDHAQAPETILGEIHRVLRPGGFLAFSVSTLSIVGELKWKLNRRRRPDEWHFLAHPHTYTWSRIDRILRRLFSKVLWSDRAPLVTQWIGRGRMSYWLLQKADEAHDGSGRPDGDHSPQS